MELNKEDNVAASCYHLSASHLVSAYRNVKNERLKSYIRRIFECCLEGKTVTSFILDGHLTDNEEGEEFRQMIEELKGMGFKIETTYNEGYMTDYTVISIAWSDS